MIHTAHKQITFTIDGAEYETDIEIDYRYEPRIPVRYEHGVPVEPAEPAYVEIIGARCEVSGLIKYLPGSFWDEVEEQIIEDHEGG